MELNNYRKIVELYHLMNDDESLRQVFYTNDYPVPYKSLTLYPVQVDLYYYFHLLAQCLVVPHKTSGDVKAISMSYLKFICYLAIEKHQPEYITFLNELLLIVLRKEKTYIDKEGRKRPTIEINLEKALIKIEGNEFGSKDFDNIKNIILEQNAIEIPDENINPELVKAYHELEEYKLKQCQNKMCSFEDQINIIVAKSSYRRDEIMSMTIRSFTRLLERVDKIIDYEVNTPLRPYMSDKDQKQIEHYASDTSKTFKQRCEESFTDLDTIKKKVEG